MTNHIEDYSITVEDDAIVFTLNQVSEEALWRFGQKDSSSATFGTPVLPTIMMGFAEEPGVELNHGTIDIQLNWNRRNEFPLVGKQTVPLWHDVLTGASTRTVDPTPNIKERDTLIKDLHLAIEEFNSIQW